MTEELSGTCVVALAVVDGVRQLCQRRAGAGGLVCDGCRSRLSGWLRELPELYADVLALGYVERDGRDPKVVYPPGHDHAGQPVPHFDPVANPLTAGPLAGQSAGGRVSGSPSAPIPIHVDAVDLAAAPRVVHLASQPHAALPSLPCRFCRRYHPSGSYTRHAVTPDSYADQAGHLSVASVLDSWVRDWREVRNKGERLPDPQVPVLARWLGDRLEWACDTHPAIDEFAGELRELRSALYGVLGLFDVPDYKHGVRCRSCDALDLVRRSGSDFVECDSCGLLLSPGEFTDWVGLLAADAKRRVA